MKKSGLRIAAIVLASIALLAFIFYVWAFATDISILLYNRSEDADSKTAAGNAVGLIIMLFLTFVSGGISAALSVISLGMSAGALKKRDVCGKVGLSAALIAVDAVIILSVIVTILILLLGFRS